MSDHPSPAAPAPPERLSSGAPWLDEILHGGFLPRRSYLVRGGPGAGKTTLGLQFLIEGVRCGERVLYITLGEAAPQIRENAARLGLDLTPVEILDLSPSPAFFADVQSYEIFTPAEVEREPVTRKIIAAIDRVKPQRIFVDPMSQLRYLSQDAFQFRRQVLSFLHFLQETGATVMFTSESTESDPDDYIQIVGDAVINLDHRADHRTLTVTKYRGSSFENGPHAIRLTNQGMRVFPRLVPGDFSEAFTPDPLGFGLPQLDHMLNGGLERGTVSLITGPSGVGKTSLGLRFMREAATRGERAVVFTFEEEVEIMMHRCAGLGMPIRDLVAAGSLIIRKIEPLRYSADEFARIVRDEVEQWGARVIMIDSVTGFRLSLQGEDLVERLHAQCKYLQNMGIALLLINEVEAIAGDFRVTDFKISYLADNVLFIRYLEKHTAHGVQLGKALGVLKKRLSSFDPTVRELHLGDRGIDVGEPLRGVDSILSHFPVWKDAEGGL